jgi:hypothetical protein
LTESRSRVSKIVSQEIVVGALICAGAALVVIALTAGAVLVAGLAPDARHALDFRFAGVPRTPGAVLSIALHNARLVTGTLLCALAAQRVPRRARPIVDLSLASLAAVNAVAVGVALAAYGPWLVLAVALHLPLELAALSMASGAYMSARKRPPRFASVVGIAATCLLLLVAAATLEIYGAGVLR